MPGQYTWTFDAPTGVWKNHALSAKVFEAAVNVANLMQFVMPVDGYGRKRGENVTIPRVGNLDQPATSARLEENKMIPEDSFSTSTKGVTVSEWGRAVTFTNYANELSPINLPDLIEGALTRQMSVEMDRAVADAMTGTNAKVKAIPTSETQVTFDTDGVASSTGEANLNYAHVEQIRDYALSTLAFRTFPGDEIFCAASTKALRGIKTDSKYEVWNRYTSPENKAKGEVGKIEGVRFIEVANTAVLSGSLGTAGVQGEAVFFGMDAVAMAQVLAPHLRTQAVPGDFGRSMAVAWYGILDFDVVWDTANPGEANIIHFTSA